MTPQQLKDNIITATIWLGTLALAILVVVTFADVLIAWGNFEIN